MGVGRTSGRDVTLTGHATVLLVSNVRQATEYYRDALGFEVKLYDRIPDDYRYAERDGCHIHLACFPASSRARTARPYRRTCSTPTSGSTASKHCTPSSWSVRDRDGYVLAFGERI